MPWQFFIVLYFVFAVSRELFTRWFAQRSKLPSQVIAAISYVLGVLPVGLTAGLLARERIITLETKTFILLFLVGVFITLFLSFSYAAKKRANVALTLTLHQVYVIVAGVLGWLLLDEKLSAQQIVGGILLLGGAYLVIKSIRQKGSQDISLKGAAFAILGGMSLGAGIVAEKATIDTMNASGYFILGWGVQTVFTILFALPKARVLKRTDFNRFELKGAAVCGLLTALGGFSFINTVVRLNNVGIAVLLTSFTLPLSTLASHFILGERDNGALLLAGCGVSFLGLLTTAV